MKRLLKNVIVYPLSSRMKEYNAFAVTKFVFNVNFNVEDKVVKQIADDKNLILTGKAYECAEIVNGLFKWKKDFLTDRMDYVVISMMGIVLLIIEFDKKMHNRSIFIDITRLRNEAFKIHIYFSVILALLMAIGVSTEAFRNFLNTCMYDISEKCFFEFFC